MRPGPGQVVGVVIVSCYATAVVGLTSTRPNLLPHLTSSVRDSPQSIARPVLEQHGYRPRTAPEWAEDAARRRRPCHPCQEEEEINNPSKDDDDLDRREALFAMMGTVWAVTGGLLLPTEWMFPSPVQAAYGAEANIQLPNPLEQITNRATKQCLVESLGSRECLVYADEANKLYQGADNAILLQRLEKASQALASIPNLVQSKKWSQVTGVLTGPMGELVRTMGQLAELSENADGAKSKVKQLKNDLYAMAAAVDRKESDKVLKFFSSATDDLVAFIKIL